MTFVLEVDSIKKKIGKREIIKGISFSIKEGEIFGFVGQNGAGKTTTIRMLVGLIRPDEGKIRILGNDVQTKREEALAKVGVIVENPEMYNYMTGRQNIIQIARMYGGISKARIDEVIEMVGLTDRIDDKVKRYSLGMKQRLGLAQALLPRPKLLILDEPTNGLDPVGIMELRDVIKKMAKETGTAVFVSSHILSEIEQVCDTVAFIDGGEIKSVESMSNKNDGVDIEEIAISTTDTEKCLKVIKNISFAKNAANKKGIINLSLEKGKVPLLVNELVSNGIPLEEIYKIRRNLEQRFIEIVEGGRE